MTKPSGYCIKMPYVSKVTFRHCKEYAVLRSSLFFIIARSASEAWHDGAIQKNNIKTIQTCKQKKSKKDGKV
jgi:hypothetical protein